MQDHTSPSYTEQDHVASEPDFYGKWVSVNNPPSEDDLAAWFITANKSDLSVVPRYWDGEAWWIYSNHHDNRTLVPNNSLAFYMPMPTRSTIPDA